MLNHLRTGPRAWRLLRQLIPMLAACCWLTQPVSAQDGTAVQVALTAGAELAGAAPAVEVLTPLAASEVAAVELQPAPEQIEIGIDEAVPTPEELPVLLLGDAIAVVLDYSPGLDALQWQSWAAWQQAESVLGHAGLASEFSILGLQTDGPLNVFASKLSQGRVAQADFDPARLNDPDFTANIEYKLKLLYPLFTSGRIRLLSDALKLNGEALDFDRLRAEHELTGRVIELYIAHDLLEEQLVVLADAQLTLDEHTRMIKSLYDEGLVVGADLAAADVEQANLSDETNKAQLNLRLMEELLGLLSGKPGERFASQLALDPALLATPELEAAYSAALSNRPDLQAMERRTCAATNMLNEALRKRNPTLGAFAEGKHASSGWPGDGNSELTVGAQLTLDLDTAGVLSHEIEQKRAELQAALSGLQQLQDLAKIDVAQAHSALQAAQGSRAAFAVQSARAAENLRVVRNRYREGLTNYLDLRMAATQLKESRLRELNADYGGLLAYMRLLVATGELGTAGDPFVTAAVEPLEGAAAAEAAAREEASDAS